MGNTQHCSRDLQILTANWSLLFPASMHHSLQVWAMSPYMESEATTAEATTAEHMGPGPASPGLSTHSITSSGQGQKPEGLISSRTRHLHT